MRTVELRQAFMWTCDECGAENFARAIAVESKTQQEVEEQIRGDLGLEEYESIPEGHGGQFVMAPTTVTCTHCCTEYETTEEQ